MNYMYMYILHVCMNIICMYEYKDVCTYIHTYIHTYIYICIYKHGALHLFLPKLSHVTSHHIIHQAEAQP